MDEFGERTWACSSEELPILMQRITAACAEKYPELPMLVSPSFQAPCGPSVPKNKKKNKPA